MKFALLLLLLCLYSDIHDFWLKLHRMIDILIAELSRSNLFLISAMTVFLNGSNKYLDWKFWIKSNHQHWLVGWISKYESRSQDLRLLVIEIYLFVTYSIVNIRIYLIIVVGSVC